MYVVKERPGDLSCLLNCLRVSLLRFSSFCSTLSMILFTLSRRCSVHLYGGGVILQTVYNSVRRCWVA